MNRVSGSNPYHSSNRAIWRSCILKLVDPPPDLRDAELWSISAPARAGTFFGSLADREYAPRASYPLLRSTSTLDSRDASTFPPDRITPTQLRSRGGSRSSDASATAPEALPRP